jgi:nicotinamide phosphoribosyltransferase
MHGFEGKGVVECLWDIFGGTINSKGYKVLDPHIGVIYGDSITLDRCRIICQRLEQKGFSSSNVVFGVGSYTYQYNTRDTFGWAMKATYAEINGDCDAIYKDPITDNGTKRSARGILKVTKNEAGKYVLWQNCTWDEFYMPDNELKLVYKDGVICD